MRILCLVIAVGLSAHLSLAQSNIIVFQSDFGLKDGAVSAMKGVAMSVSGKLQMHDLTHEIPAFNIWEGAYRLNQTVPYWPKGTVFVSVVDPGVGSERKSVVAMTKSGHYIVTPDNGTLTLLDETLGIAEVRIIDETVNRLKNSSASYTFHGRDVYAYTGARLAAGVIRFSQVGPVLTSSIVRIDHGAAKIEGSTIRGSIDILDVQYGNIWSNIGRDLLEKMDIQPGDSIDVSISKDERVFFAGAIKFGNTFADVPTGSSVGYLNSLYKFSIAINQGNFAKEFGVQSGPSWTVAVRKK